MSRPQPSKRTKKDEGLWLLSFSDMTMILLSFFVLMVSIMRTPPKEPLPVPQEPPPQMQHVSQEIQKALPIDGPEMAVEDRKLKIEFRDGLLFALGSSQLHPKSQQALELITKNLATLPSGHTFSIAGHTDDTPVGAGGRYASNWELASARAISLMNALISHGIPEDRISVEVYGPTRPKVATANLEGDELERARRANRRVEIIVQSP
jgi:chemotaxis protein MotB